MRASNVLDAAIAIATPSVGPSVRLSVHHISDPRVNGLRYRNMLYTAQCVDASEIVVVASVTLLCPSLNPVVGRFGTGK